MSIKKFNWFSNTLAVLKQLGLMNHFPSVNFMDTEYRSNIFDKNLSFYLRSSVCIINTLDFEDSIWKKM